MDDYVFEQCPVGQKIRLNNLYVPFYLLAELRRGESSLVKLKTRLKFINPDALAESLKAAVNSGYVINDGKIFRLSKSGEQLFDSLKNVARESSVCHDCAGKNICLGL